MAAAYNQAIIHFRDANGKECQSFWSTQDQDEGAAAEYVALAEKVQAVSSAAVIAVQFQTTVILEGAATEGPYETVVDRCMVLSRIVESSKPWTFEIVAPKPEIFDEGTLKLNLSNPDVIALQEEMMATIGDATGNAIGPFRRGQRTQARGTT